MPIVVGISLRTAGKIYFFSPNSERLILGERVLVETARGPELGTVRLTPHDVPEETIVAPLKPIVRRATAADMQQSSLLSEREARALEVCRRQVEKLNLPMQIIDTQYTLDGSHVLIHFLADNRVDFRELVRELAHELHSRIELRQVGVRDEAKLLGGYGICGRQLCCAAFLSDFAPVAISMAKDQGLALNPQKISGSCGRLMCCLAFECDQYRNDRADLPRLNTMVETTAGLGRVTKLNVLSRQVEVTLPDEPNPLWFPVDELLEKKQPASAHACAGASEACGGGCGGACRSSANERAPKGRSSFLEKYSLAGAKEVEHTTAEAAPAEMGEQTARSRPRRRRKKSALSGAADPSTQTAAAQRERPSRAAVPGGQDADNGAAAGEIAKRKRPRHRKRATADPAGVPVPVGASVATTPPATPQAPSARFRPRRRRPRAGGDGAGPPSA